MADKIVSLYIDDSSLNLLVTHGKQVKKWASVSLNPGLVNDGVITDPTQVANEITQLLEAQKAGKKLIAGLSGLHCLYRLISLPSLPKYVVPEAINREAERLLPVNLDEFHLSWQAIYESAQEIKIFLAAHPRNATDALIETLRLAGVEPNLDLAPLALAKVSNKKTAILADIRHIEADIVIMIEGVPELIRSLSIPAETDSFEGRLATIRDELERTIKFYNASNPEKPLDVDVPIYISGEATENPEFNKALAEKISYPISAPSLPLEYPKGFNVNRYTVNIGLTLRLLSGGKSDSSKVNLNIQPGVIQYKTRSVFKTAVLPGIGVGVILLVYLISQVRSATADNSSIKTQISNTNQQMLLKQKKELSLKQENSDLAKQLDELEATNKTLDSIYNSFSSQQDMANADLRAVTNNVPETVKVAGVSQGNIMWTVNGWTPDEAALLTYVAKLNQTDRFSRTIVSSMRKVTEGGMNFTLILLK